MAVTYTWEITGLKTTNIDNADNVVIQTYWKKIGTEGSANGTFFGATPFSSNTSSNTAFIPFESLKESDVLDWIKAVVVGEYEVHVNEQIQKQIDESKKPIIEASLPWTTS